MSTPDRDGHITVIGVPTDVNSSFLPGAALAPNHIRGALNSASTNLWTENEIDLGAQSFPESLSIDRTLVARGAGAGATSIEGTVQVSGAATDVTLEALAIEAVPPLPPGFRSALAALSGAQVLAVDVTVRLRTILFADGFESGTTSEWGG